MTDLVATTRPIWWRRIAFVPSVSNGATAPTRRVHDEFLSIFVSFRKHIRRNTSFVRRGIAVRAYITITVRSSFFFYARVFAGVAAGRLNAFWFFQMSVTNRHERVPPSSFGIWPACAATDSIFTSPIAQPTTISVRRTNVGFFYLFLSRSCRERFKRTVPVKYYSDNILKYFEIAPVWFSLATPDVI